MIYLTKSSKNIPSCCITLRNFLFYAGLHRTDFSAHRLRSAYLTTIPLFLSALTVIAVFWLLSRCYAETTTMAPLCHSTSLPEECLFNSGML